MESVLKQLERFGISTTDHGHTSLLSHLKGTFKILEKWNCEKYVCLAGLCHSIYGTESFSKTPAALDNRDFMRNLIGNEAEELTYLFGAHNKESLWKNLEKHSNFTLEDRFLNQSLLISNKNVADLITVTLANWLEQRPRTTLEFLFLRKEEFLRSKPFLNEIAYRDFLKAYGLIE